MQEITGAIISIVIALIAAIPGIMALRQQRKTQDANAANILTDASAKLVTQYEKRMNEMEENDVKREEQIRVINENMLSMRSTIQQRDYAIACRDNYIEHLLNGIKRLIAQLVSMNVLPAWQPEDIQTFIESAKEQSKG